MTAEELKSLYLEVKQTIPDH